MGSPAVAQYTAGEIASSAGIGIATAARSRLKNARTQMEIIETLEDVQATLEVLVEHLGLEGSVKNAIGARRLKSEQSRLEIERSLGYGLDPDHDARR
jgi:hypothetical protein